MFVSLFYLCLFLFRSWFYSIHDCYGQLNLNLLMLLLKITLDLITTFFCWQKDLIPTYFYGFTLHISLIKKTFTHFLRFINVIFKFYCVFSPREHISVGRDMHYYMSKVRTLDTHLFTLKKVNSNHWLLDKKRLQMSPH